MRAGSPRSKERPTDRGLPARTRRRRLDAWCFIRHDPTTSWPGLSRPSTPCRASRPAYKATAYAVCVDGRVNPRIKSGDVHDGIGMRDECVAPSIASASPAALPATIQTRHGRACPGHPRRPEPRRQHTKPRLAPSAWMDGSSPSMTA